jgi:hypothetical protein
MNDSVAAWMAVLERIEQSLEQSLRRTPEVPPAPRGRAGGEDGPLARLDRRFDQWRASLERVQRETDAVEGGLDADQSAVRAWLASASAARQRLAEGANQGGQGE